MQLRQGGELFAAGRLQQAGDCFEVLARTALAARDYHMAARARGNVGACQFALHQYQPALQSFLDARHLADTAGDASGIAVIDANVASLYAEIGELDTAAGWIASSIARLAGDDRRRHLPKMLIQLGVLRARQGRMAEALASFRQGIDGADAAADLDLYARGWNRLGEAYLLRGDLAHAEAPLLDAYRIRKLNHLPLDASYRSLGRLRLEQGDLTSASRLLDRAVELSVRPEGMVPTWDVYHYRSLVRRAQGRLPEALDDLRTAVRLAKAWRWSAPAADTARISAESLLDQVYSSFVEAGNLLYLRTRNAALIRETLEAAEDNRAASLQDLLSAGQEPADLPPAYWEALQRLQRAEIAALRNGGRQTSEAVANCRAELTRFESSAPPTAQPAAGDLLRRTQAALPSDAAFMSFHLGDRASWLWALDRSGLLLFPLPPRRMIEAEIARAVKAIRDDTPSAPAYAETLYRTLFGGLPPRFSRKSRWILALDKGLLDVPIAALIETRLPHPVYVAERHVIQIVPSATFLVQSVARRTNAPLSARFLGIGDAIYNTADPRLPPAPLPSRNAASPFRLFAAPNPSGASIALPRLVASAAELDACARSWGGDHCLLVGPRAARSYIAEQLTRDPAVVHFATHFLESSGSPSYGLIVLSMTGRGETELLAPAEIAHWKTRAELVVLSGCHSAAGAILPGAGLLGLTRAWLAAGAHSVVGSRWNIPDETGDLFASFYRTLRAQRSADPALALACAQREMIRSTGWRSRPPYWGAYFLVGSE